MDATEPEFVSVQLAQESIPRNLFLSSLSEYKFGLWKGKLESRKQKRKENWKI
jgi:hypothetical protein